MEIKIACFITSPKKNSTMGLFSFVVMKINVAKTENARLVSNNVSILNDY